MTSSSVVPVALGMLAARRSRIARAKSSVPRTGTCNGTECIVWKTRTDGMQDLAWGLPVLDGGAGGVRVHPGAPRSGANSESRSGDDLKARILGGRTDQDDGSFLDMRKERILLSLVPSMNLVDEKETAASLEGLDVADPGEDLPIP